MRFLLIAFALLASPAAAQTFPALSGRVVDQANIIPDDREAAMVRQLEELQRATSRQLVVVTLADLEGYEIEDYGYRLGRHWGIGQTEANNGVLLIVAPNERKVRIEVGYGLEPIVTDAIASRIINEQIVPRFRENDYPGGIEVGTAALVSQLAAPPEAAERRAIEAEQARQQREDGAGRGDGGGEGLSILIFIIVIFGIPVIAAVAEATGGRRRRRVSPWGARYDQRNDDSGLGWVVAGAVLNAILSGSRGGGSSWGGRGGGSWGGGGGFSGGGGSFGGGGASGSW